MRAGTNRRHTAGNLLIGFVSAVLVFSGAIKFVGLAPVVAQLRGFGFTTSWITLIALIELVTGLALIPPRTRALGLLLVSAFFGGAIATHIQHGELPMPRALLLAVCWLGVWLRRPVPLRVYTEEDVGTASRNYGTSRIDRIPELSAGLPS